MLGPGAPKAVPEAPYLIGPGPGAGPGIGPDTRYANQHQSRGRWVVVASLDAKICLSGGLSGTTNFAALWLSFAKGKVHSDTGYGGTDRPGRAASPNRYGKSIKTCFHLG